MILRPAISRRALLQWGGKGIALAPFAPILTRFPGASPSNSTSLQSNPYAGTDDQLLDEIQRGSFQFFWNETNPKTGQVKDRALLNGNDKRTMSSIAATGFGLTGLCIGNAREY